MNIFGPVKYFGFAKYVLIRMIRAQNRGKK